METPLKMSSTAFHLFVLSEQDKNKINHNIFWLASDSSWTIQMIVRAFNGKCAHERAHVKGNFLSFDSIINLSFKCHESEFFPINFIS